MPNHRLCAEGERGRSDRRTASSQGRRGGTRGTPGAETAT